MTTTKPPVLTDDEIYALIQPHPKEIGIVGVARAIEQAVLERAGADAVQIPEGYALVPIEPTNEMLVNVDEEVGGSCYSCSPWRASDSDCRRVYAAMLEAAPAILALKVTPAAAVADDETTAILRWIIKQADAAKEPCGDDPESKVAVRNSKLAAIAGAAAQALGMVRGPSYHAPQAGQLSGNAGEVKAAELVALLPGTYYMDEPEGGSVTVLEQLQRMAKDAERYRAIRNPPYSDQYGDLYAMSFQGDGDIVVKGAALDDAADAAIAASKGANHG